MRRGASQVYRRTRDALGSTQILRKLDEDESSRHAWLTGLFTLILIVFLGFVDHVTGDEMSFSVFYLLPISLAVWYSNRPMGFLASLVSATTWGIIEYLSTTRYSDAWILWWNSGVRLLFFLVVAWLLAELKTNLRRLQRLTHTDTLTGLLNRPGFLQRASAMLDLAARHGHATTIGFADLDGFKKVNDTHGHARGDALLQLVGALLSRSSRESDLAARFGGDEFAVLLPETGLAGAKSFFEKFQQLAQAELQQKDFATIGVSIGAIVFEDRQPDLNEALHLADNLMYRAKAPGSGSVIIETASQHPVDSEDI